MEPFPHHYRVVAAGLSEGEVELRSPRIPALRTAAPAEFGGPGNRWSPETLFVAAIADCFVLTFRAVARASHLAWTTLECEARGTLDRVERIPQFTDVALTARLIVPDGVSEEAARRALEKAEHGCLVTNSLKASVHLETVVNRVPSTVPL